MHRTSVALRYRVLLGAPMLLGIWFGQLQRHSLLFLDAARWRCRTWLLQPARGFRYLRALLGSP